ncbi:MAG: hypothetical protein HY035_11565 [Nitrospirae bacterium]|nr:hypothetical protein [Nitrospirota bacterium]MBI3379020.1 hypothetical protein [Nitrospirota bacterium]
MSIGKEQIYSSLIAFYLHQDRLMWSRVQTIVAVQGAVLGATYSLRKYDYFVWCGILALGVMLTVLIFFVMKRDQQVRDEIAEQIGNSFPLIPPPKWPALRGRFAIFLIVVILVGTDIALAIGMLIHRKIL